MSDNFFENFFSLVLLRLKIDALTKFRKEKKRDRDKEGESERERERDKEGERN